MELVGKKRKTQKPHPCLQTLISIYNKMLEAYRAKKDKEEASKDALNIYYQNRRLLEDINQALNDIENFKNALEKGLEALAKARAKEERKAKAIETGGCIVVKLVPCGKQCSGCPHGPYAYRVVKIGGKQVWKYLGKAGGGKK